MKINAIVCEYNPLHNGHLYLLNKSKESNPDSYTVCIMSGNFVQRGEPATMDKWVRTAWALEAGADLVLELPTFFALQTADKFALGAIKIASLISNEGSLSFGSENDNTSLLEDIAKTISPENTRFKEQLQSYLSGSLPFAAAREKTIIDCLKHKYEVELISKTVSSSNCILAIEYIKALNIFGSALKPNAVLRKTSFYNDKALSGEFSSATAIREAIKSKSDISYAVAKYVYETIINSAPADIKRLEEIISYKLRTTPHEELADIMDVNEGIENLLIKAANTYSNFDDIIAYATNKRYTASRIRRICYCLLLDINKSKYETFNDTNAKTYARVLGFNKQAQPLLKHIKENTDISLITSVKDGLQIEEISPLLELDIKATDIYSLILDGNNQKTGRDYTNQIIIK